MGNPQQETLVKISELFSNLSVPFCVIITNEVNTKEGKSMEAKAKDIKEHTFNGCQGGQGQIY